MARALLGRYGCPRVLAAYADLKERLAEIHDLQKTRSLLAWDQQVLMPAGGSGVRAEQIATLDRIAHTAFIDDEIGRLLDRLAPFEESQPYDSDEASLIRVTRLDWEKARRVPADLRSEMSRASSLALPVWAEARANSDFALFLPLLQQNLELRRRYVDCFDDYDEPYDVLLDDFERGMTTAEVRVVFERLKAEQVPLVAAASARRRASRQRPSVPARGGSSSSSCVCSSASASTAAPGGSIRPCTRSRARSARTTSG